jgi:hypothetical protein
MPCHSFYIGRCQMLPPCLIHLSPLPFRKQEYHGSARPSLYGCTPVLFMEDQIPANGTSLFILNGCLGCAKIGCGR